MTKPAIKSRTTRTSWRRRLFLSKASKPLICVLVFAALGTAFLLYISAATSPTVISLAAGGKCLDNKRGAAVRSNPVQIYGCHGQASQQWDIRSDGTVRVQGYCLDVKRAGTAPSTPVQIYSCHGGPNQQWYQRGHALVNRASNLCLDNKRGRNVNSNPVQIYLCNGGGNQQWIVHGQSPTGNGSVTPAPSASKPGVPSGQRWAAPWAHANPPAGSRHYAVPTVTFDYRQAPDLAYWSDTTVGPILRDWYQYLAEYYLYPGQQAATSFAIVMDPTYGGTAHAVGNRITLNPAWARANLGEAPGALVYELVHIIQTKPGGTIRNAPVWITEGMADYSRDYQYRDRPLRSIAANEIYLNGGQPAAGLLALAERKSAGTFQQLTTISRNGGDAYSLLTQRTGKTTGQLWQELTGRPTTSPGPVRSGHNLCVAVSGSNATATGVRLQAQTCVDAARQVWAYGNEPDTANNSMLMGAGGVCMDVAGAGTANGTPVQSWQCNNGVAQRWTSQRDGSLMNPHSGKCLQTVGGSTVANTVLEISTCNGSAIQKWLLPTT